MSIQTPKDVDVAHHLVSLGLAVIDKEATYNESQPRQFNNECTMWEEMNKTINKKTKKLKKVEIDLMKPRVFPPPPPTYPPLPKERAATSTQPSRPPPPPPVAKLTPDKNPSSSPPSKVPPPPPLQPREPSLASPHGPPPAPSTPPGQMQTAPADKPGRRVALPPPPVEQPRPTQKVAGTPRCMNADR